MLMCQSALHEDKKFFDPLGLHDKGLPDPLGLYDKPLTAEGSVEPPAPPPRRQDPAVQAMRNRERRRLQTEGGRRSTILTGGQGAEQAPLQPKTLLGG